MANAVQQDPHTPSSTNASKEPSASQCGGRKFTCCSLKTFYTITLVVGAILLVVGILALIGQGVSAESTGFAGSLHHAAHWIAEKLGSDLLTLAIFVTAFGGAAVSTGTVGLAQENKMIKS